MYCYRTLWRARALGLKELHSNTQTIPSRASGGLVFNTSYLQLSAVNFQGAVIELQSMMEPSEAMEDWVRNQYTLTTPLKPQGAQNTQKVMNGKEMKNKSNLLMCSLQCDRSIETWCLVLINTGESKPTVYQVLLTYTGKVPVPSNQLSHQARYTLQLMCSSISALLPFMTPRFLQLTPPCRRLN